LKCPLSEHPKTADSSTAGKMDPQRGASEDLDTQMRVRRDDPETLCREHLAKALGF